MTDNLTATTDSALAPAPAADPAPSTPSPQPPAPTSETPAGSVMSEAPAAPEGEAPADPPTAEPPIVYDLKLPETFQVDETALTDLQTLAAEAKLPPDQAQKFVDLHVKATEAFVAQQQQAFQALQTQWANEVSALPDFATPAAREASLRAIASALDEFGSPEVRSAFEMTGAGNNPHIVSLFLKMSKALSEGAPTTQGNPPANPKTPTQSLSDRLYPQGN